MIRTTEVIAREVIAGLFDDVQGYTNPTNDGLLAPWMMARTRAQDIVQALDQVCKTIEARPIPTAAQLALRHVAEAAFAGEIPVETAEEREELDRIEAAQPVVFNLSEFAASVCGMKRRPA